MTEKCVPPRKRFRTNLSWEGWWISWIRLPGRDSSERIRSISLQLSEEGRGSVMRLHFPGTPFHRPMRRTREKWRAAGSGRK